MALLVLAILIAAVISKEAYFVHGDIGTASFYKPPYIRKIFSLSFFFCSIASSVGRAVQNLNY